MVSYLEMKIVIVKTRRRDIFAGVLINAKELWDEIFDLSAVVSTVFSVPKSHIYFPISGRWIKKHMVDDSNN